MCLLQRGQLMFCPGQWSDGRVAAVLSDMYVEFLYHVCGNISQLEDSAKNNAYIKKRAHCRLPGVHKVPF